MQSWTIKSMNAAIITDTANPSAANKHESLNDFVAEHRRLTDLMALSESLIFKRYFFDIITHPQS